MERIQWKPPSHNWLKLITDASVKGVQGHIAIGGVLRDWDGNRMWDSLLVLHMLQWIEGCEIWVGKSLVSAN